MSHVKNVIQTSDVFAAALQHLNRDSVIELVHQVMTISETVNNELSVEVNTKITNAKTELQTAINILSVKTDQALAAAKILEGGEIDQLVKSFQLFIETTGMQKIIQNAAVTIGPTSYRLGSVLEVMALADKDAQLEILHNADGTELTGVRYTLIDGYVVTLNASIVDEGENGVRRYTFTTDNWRGITAYFNCTYRRMVTQFSFCRRTISAVRFLPVLHTNLVFDLCNKFEILKDLTESDVLPNLSSVANTTTSSSSTTTTTTSSSHQ
jgi:hypothetical protein